MKVTSDAEPGTMTVLLRDAPARVSEEEKSGVILDYDADDRLIAIEILDASTRVDGRRYRPAPGHPPSPTPRIRKRRDNVSGFPPVAAAAPQSLQRLQRVLRAEHTGPPGLPRDRLIPDPFRNSAAPCAANANGRRTVSVQ